MLEEKRFSFFLFTIELRHQRRCKYVSRVVFKIDEGIMKDLQNHYMYDGDTHHLLDIFLICNRIFFQQSKGKNSKDPRTRVEWQELP